MVWYKMVELTNVSDGAASRAEQTLVMNVTSLPVDYANYRIVKTTENGQWYFGPAVALDTRLINITVILSHLIMRKNTV